jgi:hypothetical protein
MVRDTSDSVTLMLTVFTKHHHYIIEVEHDTPSFFLRVQGTNDFSEPGKWHPCIEKSTTHLQKAQDESSRKSR